MEKYLYLKINARRKEFINYSIMRSSDFETNVCRTKKYGEQYLSQYSIGSMSGEKLLNQEKSLLKKPLDKRNKVVLFLCEF